MILTNGLEYQLSGIPDKHRKELTLFNHLNPPVRPTGLENKTRPTQLFQGTS